MRATAVRAADVLVTFTSPTSCSVELTVDVPSPATIEHRVEAAPGSRIELSSIRGATADGQAYAVGHTRALMVRSQAVPYTLIYRVEQPPDRQARCPLWIPTLPTEGAGEAVRIVARIPSGATAAGTMPGLRWSGDTGTATIGHLPAFVRVPYALEGAPAPWDIAYVMDAVAIATLVVATLAWVRFRRRGQAPK